MIRAVRFGSSSLAFIALALSVVLWNPGSAFAWSYGSQGECGYLTGNSGYSPTTTCVSKANNRYHAVRLEVVGNQWAGMDTAVAATLSSDYDPTHLIAYIDQSDPYPDVKVYDQDYGGAFPPAWVDCPADNTGVNGADPNRWCRGQKLRFNGAWEAQFVNSNSAREGLACHEMGHTLGLRHIDDPGEWNSCMETSAHINSASLSYYHSSLHSHDIYHLNLQY